MLVHVVGAAVAPLAPPPAPPFPPLPAVRDPPVIVTVAPHERTPMLAPPPAPPVPGGPPAPPQPEDPAVPHTCALAVHGPAEVEHVLLSAQPGATVGAVPLSPGLPGEPEPPVPGVYPALE